MENNKKTKNTPKSLGSLCAKLSKANIMIYHYENLKWWGRKDKRTSTEIDNWDRLSRVWCERRSNIKNSIDRLIKSKFVENKKNRKTESQSQFPFQVLPISLMIDMLTIENIKIYDLRKKGNIEGAKKASARLKALKTTIDKSLNHIISSGRYQLEQEVRTF